MINALHRRYIENLRAFIQLENYEYSGDDIVAQIIRNSKIKKRIKDENEEILGRIKQYGRAPDSITPGERDDLEAFAAELSNRAKDLDSGAAGIIRKMLLERARLLGDMPDLIWQLCGLGAIYFYMHYRNSLSSDISYKNPYYDEVCEYEYLYDGASPETKGHILLGHNNSNSHVFSAPADEKIRKNLEVLAYNKALKKRYPKEYRDADYDHTIYAYNNNLANCVYKFLSGDGITPFNTQAVYNASVVALSVAGKWPRAVFHLECICRIAMYYNHMIDARALLEYFQIASAPGAADDDGKTLFRIFEIGAAYIEFAYGCDFLDVDEKRKIADEKIELAMRYATKLRVNVDQYEIDRAVRLFFATLGKIVDYAQVKDALFGLTVYRHKPTYVHTITVSRLSEAIARILLEKNPSCFDGCFERRTDDKEEIIARLGEMAMMHDIGKIGCINFIQNFSRNLTDDEFGIIKQHPLYGRMFLPESTPRHVMDGVVCHHLWHNGKGGYPYDLPPTNNQPLVDILSVADSLDAATDFIGRPYSKAKTVRELAEELNGLKGTRYAKDVVEALADERLLAEVERIIGPEREALIQEVYNRSGDA